MWGRGNIQDPKGAKGPSSKLPANIFLTQGSKANLCPAQSALYTLFSAGHSEEAGGFGDK